MKELLDYVKSKESEIFTIGNIRVNDEYKATIHDFRNDADVDYSRVLYSSSCRRLQGKMQLFIPKSEVFYRNRLTHSLEVAQIAKTIANRLQLNDCTTVQTCSLAHDIGNPPFGHAGEIFLSKCDIENPYEGNAQTFRTINKLEERHYDYNGLNLTIRTMLGVVKYFNNHKSDPKKFLYDTDYEMVKNWLSEYKISHKTIDCEIMDLSDEIAYAVHDLEDALKLKLFTIDELLYEFSINLEYKPITTEFKKIIIKAKNFAEKAIVYETSEEYSMLFRKELSSLLVGVFVMDIGLVDNKLGYLKFGKLVKGLKTLTFESIKRQPDIIEYEQLGKHVLTKLFELYSDKDFNKGMVLMPANYRSQENWTRRVLDYIGGMMDIYAIQQYEKYFGKLEGKGLYFK